MKQGSKGVLTEARNGRERGAGEVIGVKRRWVGAGFGERSMGRSSGPPGSHGSTSDGTAKPSKGLGRAEDHWRRVILAAEFLTGDAPLAESRRRRDSVRGQGARRGS